MEQKYQQWEDLNLAEAFSQSLSNMGSLTCKSDTLPPLQLQKSATGNEIGRFNEPLPHSNGSKLNERAAQNTVLKTGIDLSLNLSPSLLVNTKSSETVINSEELKGEEPGINGGKAPVSDDGSGKPSKNNSNQSPSVPPAKLISRFKEAAQAASMLPISRVPGKSFTRESKTGKGFVFDVPKPYATIIDHHKNQVDSTLTLVRGARPGA